MLNCTHYKEKIIKLITSKIAKALFLLILKMLLIFCILPFLQKSVPEIVHRPYLMVEKTGGNYVSRSVYLMPMKCSSNDSDIANAELRSCLKEKEGLKEIVENANRKVKN